MILNVQHGSQIQIFPPSRIPDPEVEKAPDPGSRIRIRITDLESGLVYTLQLYRTRATQWQLLSETGYDF
jgi:hypothetical protein